MNSDKQHFRKLKVEELNRLSVEEFKQQPKISISIVLDNIRSLHNIGSLFRTADAFKLAHIYLCGFTATPPHREIRKTALGATESVSWSYHKDIIACVNVAPTISTDRICESCILRETFLPNGTVNVRCFLRVMMHWSSYFSHTLTHKH